MLTSVMGQDSSSKTQTKAQNVFPGRMYSINSLLEDWRSKHLQCNISSLSMHAFALDVSMSCVR